MEGKLILLSIIIISFTVPLVRFACTVCDSRPVFDNLMVLSVHRRGKKHIKGIAHT